MKTLVLVMMFCPGLSLNFNMTCILLMDPNSDTIYNSEDDNKENITQKVISLMALIKHFTVYIK